MTRPLLVLSGLALLVGIGLALAPWWASSRPASPSTTRENPSNEPETFSPVPGLPWFEDVTDAAGIDFRHNAAATPRHLIQETMGSGIGWIDYDRDGWPDLFCVQVGPVPADNMPAPSPSHRLYRNLGNGRFRDVTAETGVGLVGYGMGVEVGDYDNDGYDDLLLSELGGVRLLHNEPASGGGRRFVDVTARAGLVNPHWATSCAWGDFDGDGRLDLYVANYVEIDPAKPLECRDFKTQLPQSCTPTAYPLTTHRLFRNRGNGTFEDVSQSWGIARVPPAPGLGVVAIDLDDDGHQDIYVANDMKPAYLFHNTGKGGFVEKAISRGCGLGNNGNTMAGMGVLAADFDGSGRPSLLVTNFQFEPNVLFLNRGQLRFDECSHPSGLGLSSLNRLGFGVGLLDVDRDGLSDVAVVNGHVNRHAEQINSSPYAQQAQLFLGQGRGRFRDVSTTAGSYFRSRHVGRGLAVADFDNDGLPDLAVSNNGGRVHLLRNRSQNNHHALGLQLVGDGGKSNRNAIGARVEVETELGTQVHFLCGGGSYLSSSDRRLLIGLGTANQIRRVSVRWPSGRTQHFHQLASDRCYRLTEAQSQVDALFVYRAEP